MAITVQNSPVLTLLGATFSEMKCCYIGQNLCICMISLMVAKKEV